MGWCRRGDTNSFNVEIAKFARKFAECVDSLGFPFSVRFLFSLYNSLYSLSCSLVIDTKQTPNLLLRLYVGNAGQHNWLTVGEQCRNGSEIQLHSFSHFFVETYR